MVDRVIAKDRANFCDWFQPALRAQASGTGEQPALPGNDPEALRRAAEDLFK
jgi:hypothetical protein